MNIIDIINTPDYLEEAPITRYFLETKGSRKPWNTLAWLQSIDDDTFKMLDKCVDLLVDKSHEDREDEGFGLKNFVGSYGDENNENISDDIVDYVFLVAHCFAEEKGITFDQMVSLSELEELWTEASVMMAMFLTLESLRRKGYVEFNGTGKISEKDTNVKLTPLGKIYIKQTEGGI